LEKLLLESGRVFALHVESLLEVFQQDFLVLELILVLVLAVFAAAYLNGFFDDSTDIAV